MYKRNDVVYFWEGFKNGFDKCVSMSKNRGSRTGAVDEECGDTNLKGSAPFRELTIQRKCQTHGTKSIATKFDGKGVLGETGDAPTLNGGLQLVLAA